MAKYGTQSPIITKAKSLVVACDVPFEKFPALLRETRSIQEIKAYKIPARAGRRGWEEWNRTLRSYTNKISIYDHQKAGTDVPDTQREFMRDVKESGFKAVILYPRLEDSSEIHEAHIMEAIDAGLKVMVGGKMTHQLFNQEQYEMALRIYETAYKNGIRNFGLPANSISDLNFSEVIRKKFNEEVDFFLIGIGLQGGNLEEVVKMFNGTRFHPIVGRLIYEAKDMKQAALDLASKLH